MVLIADDDNNKALVKRAPRDDEHIVYVGQREYAVVNTVSKTICSSDATTCIIAIIHCPVSCVAACVHWDDLSIDSITTSVNDMITAMSAYTEEKHFDIHMIGGASVDDDGDDDDDDDALVTKVMRALGDHDTVFHVKHAIVGAKNTTHDRMPRYTNIALCLSDGDVYAPVDISIDDMGPERVVRSIRGFMGDPCVTSFYDTQTDVYRVTPFSYSVYTAFEIMYLLAQTDQQLLMATSTSPHCEPVHFASRMREMLEFMRRYPSHEEYFKTC